MRKIMAEIYRLEQKLALTYEEYATRHPATEKGKDDPLFSKKRKKRTWKPKQLRPIPPKRLKDDRKFRHFRPVKKKKPHKPAQPYLLGVQPKRITQYENEK